MIVRLYVQHLQVDVMISFKFLLHSGIWKPIVYDITFVIVSKRTFVPLVKIYSGYYLFIFWDRVSMYLGCLGTGYLDQVGLEHRNPPMSVPWELGLKVSSTTPGCCCQPFSFLLRFCRGIRSILYVWYLEYNSVCPDEEAERTFYSRRANWRLNGKDG